jgi:glutathione synthase/RimK-type ligase-like ATP-grasp enzyme
MILLISPKQVYATKRFIKEAKKFRVALKVFDVRDLAKRHFKIGISRYQTLFVRQGWPYEKEIVTLAQKFHRAGKKVVDEEIVRGELSKGKMQDYQRLSKTELLTPKTFWLKGFKSSHLPLVPSPYMIKWNYGFKGRGVFLIENKNQLRSVLNKYPKKELLAQEFIPADYEYKVITAGFKALPVILRFAMNQKTHRPDFRKTKVIPSFSQPQITRLAEKASETLKRELAKVDILESKGKFYILEVNRWPGLKSFEQLTKYNVTKEFLRYLTQDLSKMAF